MTRITVRVQGHYEVHEAPFSRSYKWHPSAVTLVCDCGEEQTFTDASAESRCRCGADHSALIDDIRVLENQLGDAVVHPGTTRLMSRQPNADETKPLTPRAPPGATKTSLRLALQMMVKSDRRRPEHGRTGPLIEAH